MQFGNTNLSYVYEKIKNLPYIKIPLYYIPVFISLWYYPKETFMIGSTYCLFNNLDSETRRRQDDPEYNSRIWEEEFSDDEDENAQADESEETASQEESDIQNDATAELNQNNTEGDTHIQEDTVSELSETNSVNETNSSNEEEYNLVDDDGNESVTSQDTKSSDNSFWRYLSW
jgi:hypothetical protein